MKKCIKCSDKGYIECDTDRGTQFTDCDCKERFLIKRGNVMYWLKKTNKNKLNENK